MKLELTHLQRWTQPDSWFGKPWKGWYIGLTKTRDSKILDECNYDLFRLAVIGAATKQVDDTENAVGYHAGRDGRAWSDVLSVQVVCESHWACGWIEWIAIHESDEAALEKADELLHDISECCILDEGAYLEALTAATDAYWERCSIKERVRYCKENGDSIFAARRDYPPENTAQALKNEF